MEMDEEEQSYSPPLDNYDDYEEEEYGDGRFLESEVGLMDRNSTQHLSDSDDDDDDDDPTTVGYKHNCAGCSDEESEVGSTSEGNLSRNEQVRMIHMRRYIDQIREKVNEKQYLVDKTREELSKCRDRIADLERERDQVFAAITVENNEGNTASVYRLQSQHERTLLELEAEEELEAKITQTLDQAEYECAKAQVEQGKYLINEQELNNKEETLLREKTKMAKKRDEREEEFVKEAEAKRKSKERSHIAALRAREKRQKHEMQEAKQSRERANIYLKETMNRIRQQESEEEEKYRADMDKRMKSVLSLKKDIAQNRENIKAVQARDKAFADRRKEEEDKFRQDVLEKGGNPEELLLRQKRLDGFEKERQVYLAKQRQGQVAIASKILQEEERLVKRKQQQPQLWTDPNAEKKKRLGPKKRPKLKILEDKSIIGQETSTDVPVTSYSEEKPGEISSEEETDTQRFASVSRDDYIPDSDSEEETDANLAKPEFEGLWDKHKAYKVPKDADPSFTLPGASTMEKDIMQRVLDKHRSGIVIKQVAGGKEFKGVAFYAKPDVIHFKDFDVGKTYKKRVILTNVSYSVNYCKLTGLTEHLKDFIDLQFDPPGQMSAGLTCELFVTFKPMINQDLGGEVHFLSQTGPFTIPLLCTTKKCDLSVDCDQVDFGTAVIGETLKRTITLTNNGALGTKFDFFKRSGLKSETRTLVESSLGRLTTEVTPIGEGPEAEETAETSGDKAVAKEGEEAARLAGGEVISAGETDPLTKEEKEADKEGATLEAGDFQSDGMSSPGLSMSHIDESLDGMRVGEESSGEIGPFSYLKFEIIWQPTIPGRVDVDFCFSFTDLLSEDIPLRAAANAIDVPVWVERPSVDLKICMYDRLYQDTIIVSNRATTALRLTFEVCKELRNHLELLPKTGYIQAQSQFSAQLKFLPRHGLEFEAGNFYDKETGVLEAPMVIRVAEQTRPVPFMVSAIVTNSDLEFDVASIDFGHCTIYESTKSTIRLANKSILPQEFGFVGIPEYVEVQPNDGFGVLLPLETIELDIIFKPKKAKAYSFELTCKSIINREFKISCVGVAVHPPLELSHQVIHFAATAVNDYSTASLHVINSHLSMNEFTHPVPRIGKGEIAPVGPTSFEFSPPEGAPLIISPSVGTIEPGKKQRIVIRFSPKLKDEPIRIEAVRMLQRAAEIRAEEEYKALLQKEKENQELAAKAAALAQKKGKGGGAKGKGSPKGKGNQSREIHTLSTTGPAPIKVLSKSEIKTESDEYAAAEASLIRQQKGEFETYVIPCYVASGKCGDPGDLPYSIHNTLYLEVHCPTIRPQLVVISNNGRTTTDFGDISIGQNVIKTITLQNISETNQELRASALDPTGPFELLNALPVLAPGDTALMIMAFTPTAGRVFYEAFEIHTATSTLHLTMTGQGVSPIIDLSIEAGVLECGTVLNGEYREEIFKIENTSTLSINYSIKLDSNSLLRHNKAQELPAFIKTGNNNNKNKLVGTQNYNGQSVFDCVPAEGTIVAGGTKEITVTFAPDHASDHYSDGVRIELFNLEESHVFQLRGAAKPHIMYLEGGETLLPDVESLSVLPVTEEDEEIKLLPATILVMFESISMETEFTTATKEMNVCCVRTMAVSQKKNGEFIFDNLKEALDKGFNIEPQRGMVEAAQCKPIVLTWTPPQGFDPSQNMEAVVTVILKGDVTEQYRLLLKGLVVSE